MGPFTEMGDYEIWDRMGWVIANSLHRLPDIFFSPAILVRSQVDKLGSEVSQIQCKLHHLWAMRCMQPWANYLTSLRLTSLIIKWRNNSAYFTELLELNNKMYIKCFTQCQVQSMLTTVIVSENGRKRKQEN